jgi:hypothetical protein
MKSQWIKQQYKSGKSKNFHLVKDQEPKGVVGGWTKATRCTSPCTQEQRPVVTNEGKTPGGGGVKSSSYSFSSVSC